MSSMSSYGKLCRIFGAERVNKDSELMEQIIELQTVFEDKETLLHQLRMLDGLSDSDCELLARTHYTGWGKLSRKLLTAKVGECKIGDDFALRSIASLRLCVLKIVILWKLLLIKIMVFLNGLMSRILERIKAIVGVNG